MPSTASVMTVPQDILEWASPQDIQKLRLAARVFRQVIDGPQSNSIWRSAFSNVLFRIPPATPFSPSQIAGLVFSGGLCENCRRHTPAIPYSFTLQIRFCSLACEYATLGCIPPSLEKSPVLPDLDLFDRLAWNEIRTVVLAEIVDRVSINGVLIRCSFCSTIGPRARLQAEDSLRLHIKRSHPEHAAEPIAIPGGHRCTLCDKNYKVYDRASLLRHVKAR
ncbi:hypothetical protein FB451DRAFT_1403015 [Mycena latifolia]|nr:hypothetical protein FB451DRAFT_1403015 [Mycena latifolia]